LEAVIQEKNAEITFSDLPVIIGDRLQLRQLFQNLISNALKYSKKDSVPQIKIKASQVSGQESGLQIPSDAKLRPFHRIEVADNGIGFEQGDAERIFNIFQRLHGNKEYSGTGVGLSIARKVVENHQGFIDAISQTGVGTTFRILLPL
jgi:signal transduction histidine kinase